MSTRITLAVYRGLLKQKTSLNDNQFSALYLFTFNVGIDAFKNSTLLEKLNNGDYRSVPNQLLRWVNDNGKKVQGLANRRNAEIQLWCRLESGA